RSSPEGFIIPGGVGLSSADRPAPTARAGSSLIFRGRLSWPQASSLVGWSRRGPTSEDACGHGTNSPTARTADVRKRLTGSAAWRSNQGKVPRRSPFQPRRPFMARRVDVDWRPEVLAFLQDIKANPDDETPRLILADWL